MSVRFLPSPRALAPQILHSIASKSVYRSLCVGHIYQLALAALGCLLTYTAYRIHNRHQVRHLFTQLTEGDLTAKLSERLALIEHIRARSLDGLSEAERTQLNTLQVDLQNSLRVSTLVSQLEGEMEPEARLANLKEVQELDFIGLTEATARNFQNQLAVLETFNQLSMDSLPASGALIATIEGYQSVGLNEAQQGILQTYKEAYAELCKHTQEAFATFSLSTTDTHTRTELANQIRGNQFAGLEEFEYAQVQHYLAVAQDIHLNKEAFTSFISETDFGKKIGFAAEIRQRGCRGLSDGEAQKVELVLQERDDRLSVSKHFSAFKAADSFEKRSRLAQQIQTLEFAGLSNPNRIGVKAHLRNLNTVETYLEEVLPRLKEHFSGHKLLAPLTLSSIHQHLTRVQFFGLGANLRDKLTRFYSSIPQREFQLLGSIGIALDDHSEASLRLANCTQALLMAPFPRSLAQYEDHLHKLKFDLLKTNRAQTDTTAQDLKDIRSQAAVYFDDILVSEVNVLMTEPGNKPQALMTLLQSQMKKARTLAALPEKAREEKLWKERFIPGIQNRLRAQVGKFLIPALLGKKAIPNTKDALEFLRNLPELGLDLSGAIEAGKAQILEAHQVCIQDTLRRAKRVQTPEELNEVHSTLRRLINAKDQDEKLIPSDKGQELTTELTRNICLVPLTKMITGADNREEQAKIQKLISEIKKVFGNAPSCKEIEGLEPSIGAALDILALLINLDQRGQGQISFEEFLNLPRAMPLGFFEDTQIVQGQARVPDYIKSLNPLFDRVVNFAYYKTRPLSEWTHRRFQEYLTLQAWALDAPKKGLPKITILVEFEDEDSLLDRLNEAQREGYLSASMIYRLAVICDRTRRTLQDGIPGKYRASADVAQSAFANHRDPNIRLALQALEEVLAHETPEEASALEALDDPEERLPPK